MTSSAWLTFLLISSSVFAICPPGFIHEGGFNKCYKFMEVNASYLVAKESCQEMGGDLVSIQNGFENSFVAGIAAATSSPISYWIGLNLLFTSEWSWMNRSASTFTNWAPGQAPDPSPYQCSAVRDVDYRWTKELCNSQRPYMCTTDPEDPTTRLPPSCPPPTAVAACPVTCPLNATCDTGYRLFHGTCQCYKADTRAYSYSYAQSTCQAEGGHFTFILSPEENFFLLNLMQDVYAQAKSVWIGLECLNKNISSCAWLDGSQMDGYSNFAVGHPNGQTPFVTLDYASFAGKMEARWSSPKNPTGSSSWICQKDAKVYQLLTSFALR